MCYINYSHIILTDEGAMELFYFPIAHLKCIIKGHKSASTRFELTILMLVKHHLKVLPKSCLRSSELTRGKY